jgi:hypothetical protein
MPLPQSGIISIQDIKNEFNDTRTQVALGDYYRGGPFVTPNNGSVPTGGLISLNNFRGAFRTLSNEEVYNIFRSANRAANRNLLFSRTSIAQGFEGNTSTSFASVSSHIYRYANPVSGTLTWPALADNFKRLSWITVVARNYGFGAGFVSSIVYNGQSYPMTLISNFGLIRGHSLSFTQINTGYNPLEGRSISASYSKASSNNENLQELTVFPGKWDLLRQVASGGGNYGCGSVQRGDLAITMRAGFGDGFVTGAGNYSGVSFTEVLRRDSRWYSNTGNRTALVESNGTLNFANDGTGHTSIFRLSVV